MSTSNEAAWWAMFADWAAGRSKVKPLPLPARRDPQHRARVHLHLRGAAGTTTVLPDGRVRVVEHDGPLERRG